MVEEILNRTYNLTPQQFLDLMVTVVKAKATQYHDDAQRLSEKKSLQVDADNLDIMSHEWCDLANNLERI